MQLVAGAINNTFLESLHATHTPHAEAIRIAVAYADAHFLGFLNKAAEHKRPLTFYGRYDERLPVQLPVIDWFLENKWRTGMSCLLVPDYYHPKVIWWQGRGAYIGSANLSKRAWFDNIEIGTFFSQEDLESQRMVPQLEQVFRKIDVRAVPISSELRKSMLAMKDAAKTLDEGEKAYREAFEKKRWIGKGAPLSAPSATGRSRSQSYERLRNEVTAHMDALAGRLMLAENRPPWMPAEVPAYLQVDQFLYAYDEQFPGNRGLSTEEVASANSQRHQRAVEEAVVWWRSADYRNEQMEQQVTTVFTLVSESFGRHRILDLTKDQFVDAFSRIHAVQERARNRSNESLGFAKGQTVAAAARLKRHAEQVFDQRSKGGKSMLQMLEYVLWKDNLDPQDRRIYNGARDPLWAMPAEVRENTLSDLLGWVRPDDHPPINGRTVKALEKLGYKIASGQAMLEADA